MRRVPSFHSWALIGGSAIAGVTAVTSFNYRTNAYDSATRKLDLVHRRSLWTTSTIPESIRSWLQDYSNRIPIVTPSNAQCYNRGPILSPEFPGDSLEDKRKVVTVEYDETLRPLVPVRPQPPKRVRKPSSNVDLRCDQHIYFWGNRENLPYGFDGVSNTINVNDDGDVASRQDTNDDKPSRGSSRPYLEDVGPQIDGHFKPHASRWFDTHQYDWKSIELGSHFGAALTDDGDVYLWGSFIPPLALGPYPIIPTPTITTKDGPPLDPSDPRHPTPTLTLILHQSLARIPIEFRRPTYPEQLAIDEAEKRRVFVGPIKMNLNFKVKQVKSGVNKLFFLTTKGQVYCLDDLIHFLHWVAFDHYVAPSPPISNPYKTLHNAILDMKAGAKKLKKHRKRTSLTSTLPPEFQKMNTEKTSTDATTDDSVADEFASVASASLADGKTSSHSTTEGEDAPLIKKNDVDENEEASVNSNIENGLSDWKSSIDSNDNDIVDDDSKGILLSLDELAERVPSQVLLETSGEISIPPNYTIDGKTKLLREESESSEGKDDYKKSYPDVKVTWAPRPDFFLLRQLPQPGYLFGKGIETIAAGFDHLACLTYTGELYCLGDNSYGQCGVNPDVNDQQVVGIAKIRRSDGYSSKRIKSIACGAHHTVFQDDEGVVYAFGDDTKLQLGLGDTRQDIGHDLKPSSDVSLEWSENLTNPIQSAAEYGLLTKHQSWIPTRTLKPIELSKNAFGPPDRIECSGLTTCIRYLTSPHWIPDLQTTEIHCAGDNVWGECGSNEPPAQQPFRIVKLPRQFECVQMSCGLRHCVAFLSSGELYGWGDNRFGQVGVGKPKKINKPRVIPVETTGKAQKLLRMALRNAGATGLKLSTTELEEVTRTSGRIADFVDEETARKLKATQEARMKEMPISHNNVGTKPLPRLSQDYPGDIVHISCGFESTAIIRDASNATTVKGVNENATNNGERN